MQGQLLHDAKVDRRQHKVNAETPTIRA